MYVNSLSLIIVFIIVICTWQLEKYLLFISEYFLTWNSLIHVFLNIPRNKTNNSYNYTNKVFRSDRTRLVSMLYIFCSFILLSMIL